MKIAIITTNLYEPAIKYRDYLLDNHKDFIDINSIDKDKIEDSIDVFVVLGGDGFMLKSIHKYYKYNKPFYGVNFGRVGFLLNSQEYSKDQNLMDIITDSVPYILNPLKVDFTTYDGVSKSLVAINEVVLYRQLYKVVDIDIVVNGKTVVNNYSGDGLILSSPIGSCAYNYSANGVILNEKSNDIILTPMYPTKGFGFRTALLENNSKLTFKVNNPVLGSVNLFCDYVENNNILTADAYVDKTTTIKILYNSKKTLGDKILEQQFSS